MKKEETDDFQPFIPADKIVPEFTVTSIVLGVLLVVLPAASVLTLGYLTAVYLIVLGVESLVMAFVTL